MFSISRESAAHLILRSPERLAGVAKVIESILEKKVAVVTVHGHHDDVKVRGDFLWGLLQGPWS